MYAVTFVVTRLMAGGAEHQLVKIANGLARRGRRVRVLSLATPRPYPFAIDRGVAIECLGIERSLRGLLRLRNVVSCLQSQRSDAICAFNYHANVIARLAGCVTRTPVVVTSIRNERFGGRHREIVEWATAPLADMVIANSSLVASSLLRRRIVPSSLLAVIRNATEGPSPADPGERDRTRAELGIPEGTFLWLAIGRLEPAKAHDVLLDALARIVGRRDCRLRIVGDGSLMDVLARRVAELRLGDACSLLGIRSDVPRLLRAADAFVLPSRWEGLPNVVLEAMSAGLPVLATGVSGVPELVQPGRNGLLVPPNDMPALAEAMLQLMGMPETERSRMGRVGRVLVRARHDQEAIVSAWDALFRALIAGRRMRALAPRVRRQRARVAVRDAMRRARRLASSASMRAG